MSRAPDVIIEAAWEQFAAAMAVADAREALERANVRFTRAREALRLLENPGAAYMTDAQVSAMLQGSAS